MPKKFINTTWLSPKISPKVKQVCFGIIVSLYVLYAILGVVLGVKKSYKLLSGLRYINIDSAWKSSKPIKSPRSLGLLTSQKKPEGEEEKKKI